MIGLHSLYVGFAAGLSVNITYHGGPGTACIIFYVDEIATCKTQYSKQKFKKIRCD